MGADFVLGGEWVELNIHYTCNTDFTQESSMVQFPEELRSSMAIDIKQKMHLKCLYYFCFFANWYPTWIFWAFIILFQTSRLQAILCFDGNFQFSTFNCLRAVAGIAIQISPYYRALLLYYFCFKVYPILYTVNFIMGNETGAWLLIHLYY